MTNRFQFSDTVDLGEVTVRLYRVGGQPRGDISGPVRVEGGSITMPVSRQDGMQSAEEAVSSGIGLANRLGVPMRVIGDRSLWNASWGELYEE